MTQADSILKASTADLSSRAVLFSTDMRLLVACVLLVVLVLASPTDTMLARVAFRLYDTFGFPIELTEELACENGITVDSLDRKSVV